MEAIDTALVESLYEEYRTPLRAVRDEMRAFYRRNGTSWIDHVPIGWRIARHVRRLGYRSFARPRVFAQLDDIAAELTYMLVRRTRPETMVEVSPCDGWSTCWILAALRDNDHGSLHSYDIIESSRRNVPQPLQNRWQLHVGDVTKSPDTIPTTIDYLFVDSDHSAEFARWYLEHLVPRVRPGGVISIDDIYHHSDPGVFDGEGPVVIDWLKAENKSFFTAATASRQETFDQVMRCKERLEIAEAVKPGTSNSTIFLTK